DAGVSRRAVDSNLDHNGFVPPKARRQNKKPPDLRVRGQDSRLGPKRLHHSQGARNRRSEPVKGGRGTTALTAREVKDYFHRIRSTLRSIYDFGRFVNLRFAFWRLRLAEQPVDFLLNLRAC